MNEREYIRKEEQKKQKEETNKRINEYKINTYMK